LVLSTSFRTGWSFLSGGSILYNTSVSPDGYTNAETLVGDGVNANAAYTSVSVTSGTLYTFSVFAKANTQSLFRMRGFSGAAGGNIDFDLSNGTISGATTNDDIIRSEIQDYGNGWYRCICVFEADGTGAALFGFDRQIVSSGNLFDVYGPQIEAGGYATSLIPTNGTSVTRVVDAAEKTGISSLIGATEGTFYAEFTREGQGIANSSLFSLTDGSTANRLRILSTASFSLRIIFQLNGNVNQYDETTTSGFVSSYTQQIKIAVAYKSGDIAVYINGQLFDASTDTLTFSAPLSVYEIENGSNSNIVNQALLFPTRLSNESLASLTTL
jgi:hypothetical protein